MCCMAAADDDVPLDAAADIITACCGLLACSGKVPSLAHHNPACLLCIMLLHTHTDTLQGFQPMHTETSSGLQSLAS